MRNQGPFHLGPIGLVPSLLGLLLLVQACSLPWGIRRQSSPRGGLGLGVYGLLASAAGVEEARQLTVQLRRQLAQRFKPRP